MPWHVVPDFSLLDIPGGESSDPYPAFSRTLLPASSWSGALYRRNSPGYAGTLYFTDPYTVFGGGTISPCLVRPLSYSLSPNRMEWCRVFNKTVTTVHQTDGTSILHSMEMPRYISGTHLARCRSPDGFVFVVDQNADVSSPGVYFIATSELTGAPALGIGSLPAITQKVAFGSGPASPGSVLVGSVFYFLEPEGTYYISGNPKFYFSKYDLGTSTYTQGSIMPDAAYLGLAWAPQTEEIGSPVFLTILSQTNGGTKGLYRYNPIGNTLTLLVRSSNYIIDTPGIDVIVYTQQSVNFPLVLHHTDSGNIPTSTGVLPNNDGTPTSLALFDYILVPFTTRVEFTINIVDADYDNVTWHGQWSSDGGLSWTPATILGPDYPTVQAMPTPGFQTSFFWDYSVAAPATEVDFQFVVDAPAWDSAGVTAQKHVVIVQPPPPPPSNVIVDKLRSAGLAAPLVLETASAGTHAAVNKETNLVVVGSGLQVRDSLGDPRVRAVLIRSPQATQVFDYSRFTLRSSDGKDILNLRLTVPTPGIYDIFLLDKDGAAIAIAPAGLEVT